MKRYYQFIIGLVIGMTVVTFIAPGFADAAGSTVGVIDLHKAVTSHPNYEANMAIFEDFEALQYARLDSFRDRELTDAEKTEVLSIRLEIEDEVAGKLSELTATLEDDVWNAVQAVGAELDIEIIVDSQIVLYGGMDLTPAVINGLSK